MNKLRHSICLSETISSAALYESIERCRAISQNRIPACAHGSEHLLTLQAQFNSLKSNLCALACYVKFTATEAGTARPFLPGFATGKDWLKSHKRSLEILETNLANLRQDVLFTTYVFFSIGKRLAARQPLLWKLHAPVLEYVAGVMRSELCNTGKEGPLEWMDSFHRRHLDRMKAYDATPTAAIFPETAANSVDLVVSWLKTLFRELLRSWVCTHGLPVGDTFRCLQVLTEHLSVHMPAGELMARLACTISPE